MLSNLQFHLLVWDFRNNGECWLFVTQYCTQEIEEVDTDENYEPKSSIGIINVSLRQKIWGCPAQLGAL